MSDTGRTYCSIAGANSSWWNWVSSPITIVWDVARARAPALAVKPREVMASSMRARVDGEMGRLPDSA